MASYSLSAKDNDSYMCASADRVFENMPGLTTCAKCGYKTDTFYINPAFHVKRRVYDLSYTYDGYAIASLKFKEAVQRAGLSGAIFMPLPSDPEFVVLFSESIVLFDTEKRKTRFQNLCPVCGFYGSVAGATPTFLKAAPATDISRTDVLFGSGNERAPLLIASVAAKGVFERENLAGVEYREIVV